MKILVCISHVPDTTTKVRFVDNDSRLDTGGIQWIINPWDELALTRALELKDQGLVNAVDVVNVGNAQTEATLRKALATGADQAWRLDAEPQDTFQTASVLAAWLKEQAYDIILTGISSSDYNGGAMGVMLAELTGLNSIASVTSLSIQDGKITLSRDMEGGQEVLETMAPVVVIVQKGIALEPRIPSMRGIMQARQKPLQVVGVNLPQARLAHDRFRLPQAKGGCRMIDPENLQELVRLLKEESRVL